MCTKESIERTDWQLRIVYGNAIASFLSGALLIDQQLAGLYGWMNRYQGWYILSRMPHGSLTVYAKRGSRIKGAGTLIDLRIMNRTSRCEEWNHHSQAQARQTTRRTNPANLTIFT